MRPGMQWDAVPVVWVALLFPREWVTDAVVAAPPLVLVSNILPWQEVTNPGGPRFGSRVLSCFLPFVAVMDFLCFPPFPLLLLYRCDHYVAQRKLITRQRLSLPPLCHPFVCLQNQTHCAEVFNCCVCFSNVVRGHGVSKPWQAGEPVAYISPSAANQWERLLGVSCSLWMGWVTIPLKAPSQPLSFPPPQHGVWPETPAEPGEWSYRWVHLPDMKQAFWWRHPCQCHPQWAASRGREWWRASLDRLVLVAGKCWLRASVCSSWAVGVLCPSLHRSTLRQELLFRWMMPLKNE